MYLIHFFKGAFSEAQDENDNPRYYYSITCGVLPGNTKHTTSRCSLDDSSRRGSLRWIPKTYNASRRDFEVCHLNKPEITSAYTRELRISFYIFTPSPE